MYILLDIDGVMTPANAWRAPEQLGDGFSVFTKKAVDALNELLSPGDRVVLTTSHRSRFTTDEWKRIFKARGIRIDNLELISSTYESRKRKDEIMEWLSVHDHSLYLIIDDDKSLHDLPKAIKDRVVFTRPSLGLTQEDLDSVLVP